MKVVLAILPLLVLGLAGAWEIRDYEQVHLPDFAMIKAEVLYEKCIRECEEVCAATCDANGVPEAECLCTCGHCRKYIEGEG